jgi:crotonobetainyl-CoA:carnitine CoA-transferase CaiB-like acyl-CoA transferase
MGVFFFNINRNKRSVILDLKRAADKRALVKLVETADVFVHSMRPSAAERLGVSYADISSVNPRVVFAWASGYRRDSRRRDWPAFDDVIQGMSGVASMNGRVHGEPRYFPTVIADKFCGHVLASSIAMALLWRERTGRGQEVHVPMMDTMAAFNLVEHLWGGVHGDKEGIGYSRMFTPHRRPYRTKDGYVCLLANTDEQWKRMFVVLGRPDLVGDERFARINNRARNIDELYSILSQGMLGETTAEWRRRLDAADIPNGPVNDLDDLLNESYLEETGFFKKMTHESEGPVVTTAIPVDFSDSAGTIRRLAPRLGEHTREVLEDAGIGEADIRAIAGSGVPDQSLVRA